MDDTILAQPAVTGELTADLTALTRHVTTGEELLAGLAAKPSRGRQEQDRADRIHHSCRAARARFLQAHATVVYDTVTDGRTADLRLAELVFAVADAFPGLVPTRAQMAAEAGHDQAGKEGREIDQAIFFRAVLAAPGPGRHLVDVMRKPTPRALALLADFQCFGRLDLGTVLIERHDAAAHVTFRNHHTLNAEDNRLTEDLETAVDLVLLDDEVGVGVLRGGEMSHPRHAGKRVFSAGINLKHLNAGRISFVDFLLRRELGPLNKIARGLVADTWPRPALEKPWIAAVDSFAIGGGAQLLLVVDHVIAESRAFFSLPAANEGIIPGLANLRLARSGWGRLPRQLVLGGRTIHAQEPDGGLFCDEVVEPQDMRAAIESGVRRLNGPAVVANRRMLRLAAEPGDRFREYLAEFALAQALRIHDADVLAKTARFALQSQADGERG
ncbi:(3,5-dihydroxyphenyl)acetyl-CoA 1,2-dioxygenase DpgC [Kibdelosporangium persicum]|uniref:Dihydroxyphenylglycine synthase subunit C n=1 Tax=Kibdelosporangium persicum TaxID=2698649 RepID=A0ABX2FHH2_9PSEU|nr:(3,5-dihydroxyphenyl)acetyl-CoA 1,2-dioxygenase DpgC [Kibdelosporangium persicum]NRN70668.1 Dihydroxyphenylglycine synthase subunit C [Kibdelosporangium persicum]